MKNSEKGNSPLNADANSPSRSEKPYTASELLSDPVAVLDSINAGVITIDENGIILEVNPATSRLFGYQNNDMLGRNVSMLMPEPERRKHDDYIHHHIRTGEARIIGKGRAVTGRHASGKHIPIHLSVGKREHEGKTLFTGVVQDLTFQRKIEESNARMTRILDESLNEIYTFDAESLLFTSVSRGALQNLGYSISEIRRKTPVDIKPDYTHEEFEQLLTTLIDGSQDRLRYSTVHRRKNGSDYEVDVTLTLNRQQPQSEFFAIVEDATEKNKLLAAIQQAQKMESIGQLTGGIAHDFNNLLTVISGNLELFDTIDTKELQYDLIKDARDAAKMGARLTSRLLAFASRSSLSPTSIDLNDRVLETSELVRRTLGDNIQVKTALKPELWATSVDVSQLENAILNLAINARDAMPHGGKLSITTYNLTLDQERADTLQTAPGDYVCLSIADSGTGIDPGSFDKIFEPFYTTKPASLGTGLGLSMVYGFARQSGGSVEVRSAMDAGAEFVLYLPRDLSAEVLSADVTKDVTPQAHPGSHVLVVEDQEKVRTLTRRRLEHLGYRVSEAVNGHDALQQYKNLHDIDVVFTDMIMPEGMTGKDLAIAIRAIAPHARILMTSGYADELLEPSQLGALGIDLLRKPYSIDQLKESIERCIKTHPA